MILRNLMNFARTRHQMSTAWSFHPTVKFDGSYWVHDFTKPPVEGWECPYPYSVGRYDEARPWMYTDELFSGVRFHHVGLDLGAPAMTPIYACCDGEVWATGVNNEAGSYGPTLITVHEAMLPNEVGGEPSGEVARFFVLYGHLHGTTLATFSPGQVITKGEIIGHLGTEDENGGWAPHVHVQMSFTPPQSPDMPGVVRPDERDEAVAMYPDPRLICGPLY